VFTDDRPSWSLNVAERLNKVSRYFFTQVKEPVAVTLFSLCTYWKENEGAPIDLSTYSFSSPTSEQCDFSPELFGSPVSSRRLIFKKLASCFRRECENRGLNSRPLFQRVLSHFRVTNSVPQFLPKGLKTAEKYAQRLCFLSCVC